NERVAASIYLDATAPGQTTLDDGKNSLVRAASRSRGGRTTAGTRRIRGHAAGIISGCAAGLRQHAACPRVIQTNKFGYQLSVLELGVVNDPFGFGFFRQRIDSGDTEDVAINLHP